MSYENAPATKLLATHCACCARPLLDAEPDWAAVILESDGLVAVAELFPFGSPEASASAWMLGGLETRRVANLVVHRIAARQSGPDVLQLVRVVRALGFTRLADRIEEWLVQVRIEIAGDEYVVHAPYSEAFNARLGENRPARRWDPENKCWRVKSPFRGFLFNALKAAFPGVAAVGPKGAFTL